MPNPPSMANVFKIYFGIFLLLFGGVISGQNLVPNPSFEDATACPPPFGFGWLSLATPWKSATLASPDYFNICSLPTTVGVPVNYFGYQQPVTGIAYAGMILRDPTPDYREYIEVPLTEPLQAGYTYTVSFWINRANIYCSIQRFGVYVSVEDPFQPTNNLMDVTPQFEAPLMFYNDTMNWVLISGCLVATGGESWMVIGNFHNDAETPLGPGCTGMQRGYYYVDDVSLEIGELAETIDMDLGDPVTACGSYTIDPGIPDVIYTWEDGSHGNTLQVTESGNYAVTITANCMIGMDSIDVTILSLDTVDIGPPDIILCEGDVYAISLDPDLGDYLWQDGSSDTEYEISASGSYQVTLDDGCVVTADTILVEVLASPVFSLGPDTFLCPGDQISFELDPDLGDFQWQDNSPDAEYTITEAGSYSLTITNDCGSFADQLDVVSISIPDFTLGPDDADLCEGQTIDFNLDPSLGEFLWQDGSDSPSYSISAPGYYSVTVTNECAAVDQSVNVTAEGQPYVSLADTLYLCGAQLPYLLQPDSVYGTTLLWQDGSTSLSYLVSVPGIYALTASNVCGSVSDQVVIEVDNNGPVVHLPQDTLLCAGQSLLLDVSSVNGNYLWQDGSDHATYLVSQPGFYSVVVSNICGMGIDTIQVQYADPLGIPDLGPDTALCPGTAIVLSAFAGGASMVWQDGSTADTLLVNMPGIYFVQISDGCITAADTVEISLDANPPQLSLPAMLYLCQGQSITLSPTINGVSYLWNDGSTADTFQVQTPGTYSLVVSNTCGTDQDSVIIVDAGPPPAIDLGTDVSICPGEVLTLTPASSDVTDWLWSDGSQAPFYTISTTDTISVTVSNLCGSSVDTLIAAALPILPVLNLGADTALCPGSTFILNVEIPDVDLLWSDGSNGQQFIVSGPGTYFATIENICEEHSDTIMVDALPDIPVLNLGNNQFLCAGEIITFDPGINGVDYLWQDGSVLPTYQAAQPGFVILTISNSCGSSTDTVSIIESTDGPDVNLGPDVMACEGQTVNLVSNIGGVDYLWQDGSTDDQFVVTTSGWYYVQVSNNCGSDIDSVQVIIDGDAPHTELGEDTMMCAGQVLLLSSSADPGTAIIWNDGSTGNSITIQTSGTYSILESNHCGMHTDTIHVDFTVPPVPFELGADTVLCPGDSLVLHAPVNAGHLTWQDGDTTSAFVVDAAGTYSLIVSNLCGQETDRIKVSYDALVPQLQLEAVQWICPGSEIVLDATQSFPASYAWNTGASSPSILITDPGDYSVQVITNCAEAFATSKVIASDTCETHHDYYIPNVFSPNGDNINDVFSIYFEDQIKVKSISLTIFDRWGNLVYKSSGQQFEWKGDFKGELLNPDVFVYRLELIYDDGVTERNEVLFGDVTLVR